MDKFDILIKNPRYALTQNEQLDMTENISSIVSVFKQRIVESGYGNIENYLELFKLNQTIPNKLKEVMLSFFEEARKDFDIKISIGQ